MSSAKTYFGKNGDLIRVRLAVPEDYDEAIASFAEVAAERIYINTEVVSPDLKKIWIDRWEKNGELNMFAIADIGGKIAGGIVLGPYSSSLKTAHARNLGLWIRKEFRGNGIGDSLMQYALEWAKATKSVKKITLGVWGTNERAIMLYLKFGFHIDGCYQRIALIGDTYVDEILMSIDL